MRPKKTLHAIGDNLSKYKTKAIRDYIKNLEQIWTLVHLDENAQRYFGEGVEGKVILLAVYYRTLGMNCEAGVDISQRTQMPFSAIKQIIWNRLNGLPAPSMVPRR